MPRSKAMRLPNGAGSVYKLSGRRRRPWVARVTTGWTTTVPQKGKNAGQEVPKQVYQFLGYFETKEEALDALAFHRISPVSPKANETLEEVYAEWSASKFDKISKSTQDNYRAAWLYIKSLAKAKFRDLRTAHWQKIIDGCYEAGLSRSTIQKIRTLAVLLNTYAVKNDIVSKNYASLVEMPRFEKEEKERFADDEVKAIKQAAAEGVPWADTILILIYTGLRISELLALTLQDVDLENEILRGGSKTEAGKNRIVPIHPWIIPYIKAWYDKNGEALICRPGGKKMNTKYYRKNCYYPVLEQLGVRRLTPHACRHTFVSLMVRAQVDPLYTQRIVGHSDYAFTANEYTHPGIEELKQAIRQLDASALSFAE